MRLEWAVGRLLLLVILRLACSGAVAAQDSVLEPGQVRKRLQDSIGPAQWGPGQGYRLAGQFILKATGDEISYRATYLRRGNRWAVQFSNTDPARSIQVGFDGRAWVSSAEITAEAKPHQIPYCAQYDFRILFADLIRILDEGQRNPLFSMAIEGNDVYVRGTLWNGMEATFTFNTVDFFPRKVVIHPKADPPPAWTFAIMGPGESESWLRYPNPVPDRFEVWFSDPVQCDGYRHPRRTDYANRDGVAGSFILETSEPLVESESLPSPPPRLPWAAKLSFHPDSRLHQPSLLIGNTQLATFRLRTNDAPWSGWRQTNALIALWGVAVLWTGIFFPSAPSLSTLITSLGVALLGFIYLIRRRKPAPGTMRILLLTGIMIWGFVLFSGIASIQLHSQKSRSRICLHLAIRYATTGTRIYGWRAAGLISDFPKEIRSESLIELARACEATSLAYDLVSSMLTRDQQIQIERALFDRAAPLFGALQGYQSGTGEGTVLAAGLGMSGLAIGFEPYVTAARQGMERLFRNQLVAGLPREASGAGIPELNNAVNFIYALKKTGGEDYFQRPAFQEFIRTILALLSPAGTLPLFGGTGMEDSIGASQLLLKTADYVPEELGKECVAAHDRYWMHGHFNASGWRGLVNNFLQPRASFYINPCVLFLYQRALPAAPLPSGSRILGDGQVAILRSGGDTDSAYAALHARRSAATTGNRDLLTFDLYAYGSLLLHGPGSSGQRNSNPRTAIQTADSNCVTFNGASQSGLPSGGITMGLLNQPVFDHVRAQSDRAYESGQVQRDLVLVRPDADHAPYFLLIDEIRANDPAIKARWYLHGRGKLMTGVDQISRWDCPSFQSPALPARNILMAAYLAGMSAGRSSNPRKLYFENSLFNQASEALVMEWEGSARFCAVLYPQRIPQSLPGFSLLSPSGSVRIGESDWVSLSDPETRRTTGPFTHVSEYVVIRVRQKGFPAILMISGTEIVLGPHSIVSSKPVTISMDGVRGGLRTLRPDTRIEVSSPDIRNHDRFLLDGAPVSASAEAVLALTLAQPGEHRLERLEK